IFRFQPCWRKDLAIYPPVPSRRKGGVPVRVSFSNIRDKAHGRGWRLLMRMEIGAPALVGEPGARECSRRDFPAAGEPSHSGENTSPRYTGRSWTLFVLGPAATRV